MTDLMKKIVLKVWVIAGILAVTYPFLFAIILWLAVKLWE